MIMLMVFIMSWFAMAAILYLMVEVAKLIIEDVIETLKDSKIK